MELTYCNPLTIADYPNGKPLDTANGTLSDCAEFRSLGDPSVIYHDGKWIMYPSYHLAYVTEDFVHWDHVDVGIHDVRYSPAIVQFRGKWYLLGHSRPQVYVADSPTGPFTVCGMLTNAQGKQLRLADACFLADGDRLYIYYPSHAADLGRYVDYATWGAELNPDRPWEFLSDPVMLYQSEGNSTWQNWGEYNQESRSLYLEGQWAIKRDGRYYIMISGAGTEFSTYAHGVLVSEEGPLSGFRPQKRHDPLTRKTSGLMRGAGHGSIAEGPNGSLWVFYTSIFNFHHEFERRMGMDPLGIDENGELYCPAVTDTPQFAPGVLTNPEKGNDAGLLPLTFMMRPTVTSSAPGREGIYAVDDSVLSWWQPAANDPEPAIIVPVADGLNSRISALRLLWRDVGMDTAAGVYPGAFRYVVEYATVEAPNDWHMLVDASENETDYCCDYRQFETVQATRVRLRILGAPEGITPGLVSLTVFGLCE